MSQIKMAVTILDVVKFQTEDLVKIDSQIEVLSGLTKRYLATDNLHELEDIKKQFNANLQYFVELYAKIKKFKGPNHTYLENALKKIKADAMDNMVGVNITAAERKVYSEPYYVERYAVAEQFIEFCIKVELKYDQFSATLTSIVQSISVLSKEFSNQRMSN
jgi:hypothetical protein